MQLQVVMYSDIDVSSSKITLSIGHVHKPVHATFTTRTISGLVPTMSLIHPVSMLVVRLCVP